MISMIKPEGIPCSDLQWFGVWGKNPLGECACPKGSWRQNVRDAWIAGPGTCERPGKHPMVFTLSDGSTFGFPHGHNSAVPWPEWDGKLRNSVLAAGGREAVALPGWIWVLDSDGPYAWSSLVRLFKAGVVGFDDVMGAAKTPRGWHVWIKMEHDGWRLGSAQNTLNKILDKLKCKPGLEAKSAGGYVVWPDGLERRWMTVEGFADAVAWHSRTHYGWGSAWKPPAPDKVEKIARLEAPLPPTTSPEPSPLPDVPSADALTTTWVNLGLQCGWLSRSREGARNNSLNRAAYLEGRAAIAAGHQRSDVARLLYVAARQAGLDHGETQRTIESGLGRVS